ncbi:putative disease resistance RPP13-like protein 1 [Juglans microcarpa x Juglans regia]|uniref:putative disease resistance RPP13-like protein 1 n=1 Tax=Juglans microcarpa x Juglans regia TaxID=2249226 RepID=UPI001B7E05D7|nr:putative disease resistance RPP13-like protein 1 [Juglans microcarpa x Juglans regia]
MAELAGIFLSPLLQAFFERVTSREFVYFFRREKLDQALLNKLKIALLSVNAVFEDAEEKQVVNPNVKEWLDELKDTIYDAEDTLDEIDTEVMRCELDAEFHTTTSKVRTAISTSLKVPFVKKIEPKIKQVLDRLEYLVSQKNNMGLKEGVQGNPSERLPTTSLVEESGICGREDDKEKIINSLFSDDVSGNKLFVIAIVGMGGLGKTTLAQLVYNDESVKEHFDLKAWACVSDDFDVFKVTKAILEGVDSSANGDGKTLNWLQTTLKESLTGKKFLLVLDDVWNDNYINWEVLSNPFRFGAQGSRVLVTTREERVASVMQTTLPYYLKPLPEKECWSLFVRHAFRGSIHPELEAIGRQIVEKCKGLPLAVKTIGALLWSKVDADDWNKILKSEVWDMSTEIIPALRLSYKYLPSHLKRCFAYCSIFPKDYFFTKKKLVLLWMAEGFLKKSKDKTMEQVGHDYFSDLESRLLLFKQSSPAFDLDFGMFGSRFGMHDLVNDLARFVSGQFTFRLEGGNSLQVTNKTRHLSIVENIPKTLEALYKAKGLRTFLPINSAFWNGTLPHDSLPMLRFLRVLSLVRNRNLTELPDSIGKIRHLRYLDLSLTRIRKLPDSICKLCNLQTLGLQNCLYLTALPRDMHKLVSLRHLFLNGSAITEMPLQLGRLKCLQTLDIFVVNKHCGSSNIGELGKLEYIGGNLSIENLQNVKSPVYALDASLKDKKHLEGFTLRWDATSSNISDSDQITVLENLRLHTNLKSLNIDNYGGKSFPNWIAHHSFSKIESINLYNCKYCHILPSFGQLHALESLYIIGFHGIARVGMEFYGSDSSTFKPFVALKVLKFEDMPDWVNWLCFDSENEGEAFPRLEVLHIVKCPKLTGGLPIHLPSLAKLKIVECSQLEASLPRSPTLCQLELTNFNEILLNELPSGLQKLVLKRSDALRSLQEGMMDSSSPLQELEIDGCCSLMLLSDDGLPSTLETLMISNCKKLEFPVHFNYSSLKELYLENSCDSLRCFLVKWQSNLKRSRI